MQTSDIHAKAIADKHGVTKKEVLDIYKDTFEFIHKKASALDVFELAKDGVCNYKTAFNIPNLGKLYVDEFILNKLAKQWKK